MHVEIFLGAVKALDNDNLLSQWNEVREGTKHSRTVWNRVADGTGIKLPVSIRSGEHTPIWPMILRSDIDHEQVASGCANIALLVMLETMEEADTSEGAGSIPTATTIDVLESHKMLEIAGLANSITAAKRREGDHVTNGHTLSMEDRAAYMKLSLEEAEYGNGIFVPTDPLKRCQGCKKVTNDLKVW